MKKSHDHYGQPAADNGPLFTIGVQWPAPSVPSRTSEAASDSAPPKRDTQHTKILRALNERQTMGYTRDELAAATGILLQSICARVGELKARGMVDESETITRKTVSQLDAAVLFITAKGRTVVTRAA